MHGLFVTKRFRYRLFQASLWRALLSLDQHLRKLSISVNEKRMRIGALGKNVHFVFFR